MPPKRRGSTGKAGSRWRFRCIAAPRNRPPHSHAASEKLNSVVRVVQTGPPNRTVVGIGTSSSALPIGDIGNFFQRVRCHCPRTEISASKILPCLDSQITTSYRNDCFDFLPTSQRCHP